MAALGGAVVATFLAAGIALAGDPVAPDVGTVVKPLVGVVDDVQPISEPNGKQCDPCDGDATSGKHDLAESGDAEGGDVEQDADQDNETDQDADATAKAIQVGGANVAVNVLSSGDTEQTNSNENEAEAENSNETVQVIDQEQTASGGDATSGDAEASSGADASSGDAAGGDVEQDADQDNETDQDADAEAKAIQVGGLNLGLAVLSHGGIEQTNSNENEAEAQNSNETVQVIDQDQWAKGGDATSGDATASGSNDCHETCGAGWKHDECNRACTPAPKHGADAKSGDATGGSVEQSADQDNETDQHADADANAIQIGGANVGLAILSGGERSKCGCPLTGGGGIEQTNSNENEAEAENSNETVQVIDQDQWAKGGDATSGDATASGSKDCHQSCGKGWKHDCGCTPKWEPTPCSCTPKWTQEQCACDAPKPTHHDDGAATGDATGGDVEQRAEQNNETDQHADADANALQVGGLNLALSLLSHGDIEQSNRNENSADAENSNTTFQVIDQDQTASGGDATSGDAISGRLLAA
jgi:hypothetical protein